MSGLDETKKMTKIVYKLSVNDFWDFIDETQRRMEDWVRKNKADINYECCGFASNVLYRIYSDWKIHKRCGYEKIDDVMHISVFDIRGIEHHTLVLFNDFLFDATHMQFNPKLTSNEYWDNWMYDDTSDDCEGIFKDDEILKVCKEIRPELYEVE